MWKSYEKFASTTDLHGFDKVLRYQNNKFWLGLWICLTAVAVCMCINDTVQLVVLYRSEPTAVTIAVEDNSNLLLPNPTLCMEIHLDDPFSHDFYSYSGDHISSPQPKTSWKTIEDVQVTLENDLNVFLTATSNAQNLDIPTREQLHLSRYLEYYTYMMLCYITEAELTYVGYDDVNLKRYELDYVFVHSNQASLNLNATIAYLYRSYSLRNISIANLKRLVGMSVCQRRSGQFKSQKDGKTAIHTTCKPRMITHLSFSRVCSKLFEDTTYQLANYDNFTLNGTKVVENLFMLTDQIIWPSAFWTPKVTFSWYLDFQGRETLPLNNRQDIFGWNPTIATGLHVSTTVEHQFYNTQRRPCSNAELSYNCEWRQRVAKLQTICGCKPSSLLYGVNDTTFPLCGTDAPMWIPKYNNSIVVNAEYRGFCNEVVPSFNDITCTPNCNVLIFETTIRSPSYIIRQGRAEGLKSSNMPAGLLEFSFNTADNRTVFQEYPTKSFNTFVCDFGGSVGAWLGASLLAFMHAAICIAASCYEVGKNAIEAVKQK